MSNEGEAIGQATVGLLQIVFSAIFPLLMLTLCAVSFLLAHVFQLPQFGLWSDLAGWAFGYAGRNIWAMLVLAAFVLGAVPLAWIGFRELSARPSGVIGSWVVAIIVSVGTIWLANAWAANGSTLQSIVFGILLFMAWAGIFEAAMNSLKLAEQARANRPPPPPVRQQPHGAPPPQQQQSRDEPETI
jgi:hypothetical protein